MRKRKPSGAHNSASQKTPRYLCEHLEERVLLSGLTLIAHGFDDNADTWVASIANAIDAKSGITPAIYKMTAQDDGSGGPITISNPVLKSGVSPLNSSSTNPEIIIELDWSTLAGKFAGNPAHPEGQFWGYARSTVDVGAAVANKLLAEGTGGASIITGTTPLLSLPIHLIGHSRGGSLVAEIAKDLGIHNIVVDQVTTLDPHAVDGTHADDPTGGWGDSVPEHYSNIKFFDNYWRSDPQENVPEGQSVVGAVNDPSTSGDAALFETQLESAPQYTAADGGDHNNVHLWYFGTIAGPGASDSKHVVPATGNWYPGNQAWKTTGFYYSRIGGGTRPLDGVATAFGGTASTVPLTTAGTQWSNIDLLSVKNPPGPIHIGDPLFLSYRAIGSSFTFLLFGDNDQNPFNNQSASIGSGNTSGSSVVYANTAFLNSGIKYVYAQVSGRIRFSYLPVTLVTTPVPPSLSSGQVVNGSLKNSGDYDVYSISGVAGRTALVTIGNTPGGTAIANLQAQLFSPSGSSLGVVAVNGLLRATLGATGTYYIVVSSLTNKTGDYTMTAALFPSTQGTRTPASGEAVSGHLTGGQFDIYSFNAPLNSKFVVSAGNSSSVPCDMELYDPLGNRIARTVFGFTNAATSTLNWSVANNPGTYYVLIFSEQGKTSNYNMGIAVLPGVQAGGTISSGQLVAARLDGELDSYSFTASAGGSAVVSAGYPIFGLNTLQVRTELFDPSGALLLDTALTGNIAVNLPTTGTYYVVITSRNGATGKYNLSVAILPEAQAGGALASGQTVSGEIDGELDSYTLTTTAGGSLNLSATTGDGYYMPARIDLFGPDGKPIPGGTAIAPQGQATTANLTIDALPASGTYYVVISSADYNWGAYKLTVGGSFQPPPLIPANPEFLFSHSPPQITLQFPFNVDASLIATDLVVTAVADGAIFNLASVSYDDATNIATFNFPQTLPNGNYRATLTAGSVGDGATATLIDPFAFDFFVLAGDADRDRSVGFSDLVAVAQNYGASSKTWSDGDFNGDGSVDFADLVTVAQNYGVTVPEAIPAAMPAAAKTPIAAIPTPQKAPIAIPSPATIPAIIAAPSNLKKSAPSAQTTTSPRPPAAIAPPARIFASKPIQRRKIAAEFFA